MYKFSIKHWQRYIAVGMALSLSALLLTGCGDKAASSPAGTVEKKIVAYGVIDPQISAQQIIADKKGFFKEEGLAVENKLLQSGGDIAPLISSGEAQVSFESPYTDIAVAANGVPVKIVAPMADIGNTQCVVARKDAGIEKAKDLEGKKIGMAAGSGVLIAIRNMAKDMNVDINKINFVTLSPSDQIAAMEHGDIDAMACWEPWVSNGQKAGGKLLFSGLKSYLADKQGAVSWLSFYTTMQVTDSFLKERPDDVKAMIRALKKATDFINEHPDEAAEIIAKEINLDKAEVKHIMAQNKYDMKFDSHFRDSCTEMSGFMLEMKNIPVNPAFEKYADPGLLKVVDASLVTD